MIYCPENSEIILITLDNIKIKVSYVLSYKESMIVSEFITYENKIKSHMVEKTTNEIYKCVNLYGSVKLTLWNKIVWFMWLYNYWDFYEVWSLCVWKEFRGLWLGTLLQKLLLDKYSDLPIFVVTNVDKVKNMSIKFWLKEISVWNISNNVLKSIKEWWKLLSDDFIFLNKAIFWNNKFNSLNKK